MGSVVRNVFHIDLYITLQMVTWLSLQTPIVGPCSFNQSLHHFPKGMLATRFFLRGWSTVSVQQNRRLRLTRIPSFLCKIRHSPHSWILAIDTQHGYLQFCTANCVASLFGGLERMPSGYPGSFTRILGVPRRIPVSWIVKCDFFPILTCFLLVFFRNNIPWTIVSLHFKSYFLRHNKSE